MEQTTSLGVSALTNISLSLICILFTGWVLLRIRIDKVLNIKQQGFAFLITVILAIAIGHQLALFFIQYLDWSRTVGQFLF
jgi:uncharacterized membrane protein YwzB